MKAVLSILLLTLALQAGSAPAKDAQNAVLASVKGDVLLFQGDRYLPVQAGQRVADGDRLMIMEGAEVKVVFDSGCEVVWKGAKIVDVDVESCPTLAGLWIPCMGGAAGADDVAIILSQIAGTVLIKRDGKFRLAREGEVLEHGDELKVDGKAEVNYKGACSVVYEGDKTVTVDKDSCPIAVLKQLEGEVFVDEGQGFRPAEKGHELKNGFKVRVPKESHVEISYFNGCDEAWDGLKVVDIDADKCPLAATPVGNCTPAIFGNQTSADVLTFIGTGVVLGIVPGTDDPVPPPPPISP
ncbi:hypothetical protein [Thiolapillus sp.]